MDAGSRESARDIDPQLVTHFNLQPLSQSISPRVLFSASYHKLLLSYVERQQAKGIVLRRLDYGQSCRMIAKEVGCGKTQISRIRLERTAISSELEVGGRPNLKYVKRRKTVYEELNKLVLEWFSTARRVASQRQTHPGMLVFNAQINLLKSSRHLHTAIFSWTPVWCYIQNKTLVAIQLNDVY